MRHVPRPVVLALLALGLLPATADATTSVGRSSTTTLLVQSTTPGEDSDITVTEAAGAITVTDAAGVPLQPGDGCTANGSFEVVCTIGAVNAVEMRLGPGDDIVRGESTTRARRLYGEDGADDLSGAGGNDLVVGGLGPDRLAGGPGEDVLDSDDGAVDEPLHCGAGDDDLKSDRVDPSGSDCEVISPKLEGSFHVVAPDMRVGASVRSGSGWSTRGTEIHHTASVVLRWWRCNGAACDVVQETPGLISPYTLKPADAGAVIHAELTFTNRAGQAKLRTPSTTPVIAAPAPEGDRNGPGTLPAGPPQLRAVVDRSMWITELRRALRSFGRLDPRTLAKRRTATMALALPAPLDRFTARKPLVVTWTAKRSAVARYGVRGSGDKPVILARGVKATPYRTPRVAVTVALTSAGRKVLRKAKRLRVDVVAELPVDAEETVTTTAPLTLRRR